MNRRALLLSLLSLPLVPRWAWAGSYLDRAALLLDECRRANEWLLAHLSDRELAMVIREAAEARLKAARKMQIPKEITAAHPHLLLCLENAERAASAAAEGDHQRFLQFLRQSREEEGLFRALLAQLKFQLPAVK
jgi:hypothetical protein